MNTDELISMLARDAGPADARAPVRGLIAALGWGGFTAAVAMAVVLGVRPDIAQAALLPMFWMKLGFPALLAWVGGRLAIRLGRPGAQPGRLAMVPFLLIAAVWLAAALNLQFTAPELRPALLFGRTWMFCLAAVPLLSIPVFSAALWAMRRFAPVHPTAAGAAAGLLSGGMGAAIYGLHCPELTLPFIAAWYVIAMAITTLAGAAIGSRILRW